jgi:hypothetical protein
MAFTKGTLSMAAGQKPDSPQIWTYRTNDTLAVVDGAGYFDNGATTNTGMRGAFQLGDLIYCVCTADTIQTYGFAVVNQISAAGIIDVTSHTLVGTIDSD